MAKNTHIYRISGVIETKGRALYRTAENLGRVIDHGQAEDGGLWLDLLTPYTLEQVDHDLTAENIDCSIEVMK